MVRYGRCGLFWHWLSSNNDALGVEPTRMVGRRACSVFASPIEDLPTLPLYDKVSSYIVPGAYPNLTDVKGTLSNGQLVGGEDADFLS